MVFARLISVAQLGDVPIAHSVASSPCSVTSRAVVTGSCPVRQAVDASPLLCPPYEVMGTACTSRQFVTAVVNVVRSVVTFVTRLV